MAKEYSRTRRVADQIQRHLAELIQMELGDPRVGMVTVTAVDVTHEFECARIYFSVLGDSAQVKTTTEVLNRAAGFLRSGLAKRLKLRSTPELVFVYDESMQQGNRLAALIDAAVSDDSSTPGSEPGVDNS
jgi:ribosome-binding factor A